MHRADIEIVERIEMAYLENGYTPGTGDYRGEFDPNVRCGMGAIGVGDSASIMMHEVIVGRPVQWIQAFQSAFDKVGSAATIGFDIVGYAMANDPTFFDRVRRALRYCDISSRGFRAGWSCAKRVFSKAPVEVVPLAEAVTS